MNSFLKELFEETEQKFDKVLERLRTELGRVRTGRANVSLIDDLMVEAYGQRLPLNQLASITVPEPRLLRIDVWDESVIMAIEKALAAKSIGAVPRVEGKSILVQLAPLTGEIRQDILKQVKNQVEQSRIELRQLRDAAWKLVNAAAREGTVTEDEKFKAKDNLDKLIQDKNQKTAEMMENKSRELEN